MIIFSMANFDLKSILETHGSAAGEGYAQHLNPKFVDLLNLTGFDRTFVRGEGPYLFDEDGQRYLDCIGGYACVALGRNHPVVQDALQQVLASGVPSFVQWEASPLAVALASELKACTDRDQDRVFFVNTGTEGIEAALKFARAYTGRPALAHCDNAFHGLTLGALSLNGGEWLRSGFGPFLPDVRSVAYGDAAGLETALADRKVAAFVVEPIQGKGVQLPPEGWLRTVAEICRATDTLLVMDEVQTGLGRAGSMLRSAEEGVDADIVVLSKVLSAGMVPIGAVLARAGIIDKVFDSVDRSVVHSSTFREGPLALVAGLAAVHVLREENLVERSRTLGQDLIDRLRALAERVPGIQEVRGAGLMIGVELDTRALARSIPGLGGVRNTLVSQAMV
ncbi:MAG: aspartate aminotransferase family protein, partial [Phycisphaerales bacterium]|nr:aspartate aminotransferase family protein [Phycisphaerales bacterium]